MHEPYVNRCIDCDRRLDRYQHSHCDHCFTHRRTRRARKSTRQSGIRAVSLIRQDAASAQRAARRVGEAW